MYNVMSFYNLLDNICIVYVSLCTINVLNIIGQFNVSNDFYKLFVLLNLLGFPDKLNG